MGISLEFFSGGAKSPILTETDKLLRPRGAYYRISVIKMSNVFWNIYIYILVILKMTIYCQPCSLFPQEFFSPFVDLVHDSLGWIFLSEKLWDLQFETFEKNDQKVKFPIADVYPPKMHF